MHPFRPRYALCLGLVLCTQALALDKSLNEIITRAEAQQRDMLCWAATSVSVFNSTLSASQLSNPEQRLTQAMLAGDAVALEFVGLESRNVTTNVNDPMEVERWSFAKSRNVRARAEPKFGDTRASCIEHLDLCNESGRPMLLELKFESTADGEALRWCDVRNQIDNERPILFGIEDADLNIRGRRSEVHQIRSSLHFLLVVGARDAGEDNEDEVQIWDPWPVSAGTSPNTGDHLQWIPYRVFRDALNTFGVASSHQFDRYNFQRPDTAWASPVSRLPDDAPECAKNLRMTAPVRLRPMRGAEIWQQFEGQISNDFRSLVELPARRGDTRQILPMLAVPASRIASAKGRADTIMVDEMSAAIVADSARGEIKDVYQVLHDRKRWRREGFVSIGIARTAFEMRARRGGERPESLKNFYMVSVPSSRAFFLADGPPKADSMLEPLTAMPEICLAAGVQARASDVFARLFESMLRHAGRPFDARMFDCRL